MASIDRTAYPRSKRVVSARELAEAFTPTSDEVEWARSKTTTERHFLALVVLLKSYQRLGYFPKLPVVGSDLLRTAISIREGRVSSVTLLRRLGNHSPKNGLYRAFRELGRMIRTITLLRYLPEPELREQVTAITNRAEAFHGYSEWLMVGGRLIGHNDPEHQELVVKFNELMTNCDLLHRAGHHRRGQRLRGRGKRG